SWETPLHIAARKKHCRITQLLLDYGANPNVFDRTGATLLQNAIVDGDFIMTCLLLKGGADCNLRDAKGQTSVHLAVYHGKHDLVKFMLLYYNGNVNVLDKISFGSSSLQLALSQNDTRMIKIILNHGDITPQTRLNGLQTAMEMNSVKFARYILANHCRLQNKARQTPMHLISFYNCNSTMIQMLQEMGIKLNSIDNFGNTAMIYAALRNQVKLFNYFLSTGAIMLSWCQIAQDKYHSILWPWMLQSSAQSLLTLAMEFNSLFHEKIKHSEMIVHLLLNGFPCGILLLLEYAFHLQQDHRKQAIELLYSWAIDQKHIYLIKCFNDLVAAHAFPRLIADWKHFYSKMHSPIVLTWGDSGFGRLGNKQYTGAVYTPTIISTLPMGKIAQVSCSGFGMHALTQSGSVWFWGSLNGVKKYDAVRIPVKEPIRTLSSGRTFGCALGDYAGAYMWHDEDRKNEIQVVKLPTPVQVHSLVAGWNHLVILYADQKMKSASVRQALTLERQQFFTLSSKEPIVQIAAGANFTVGVTKEGKVYLCREVGFVPSVIHQIENADGQPVKATYATACHRNLSLYDSQKQSVQCYQVTESLITPVNPFKGDFFQHHRVCKVTHGDWHGGVLTNDGQVWTWGNGSAALGTGPHTQSQRNENYFQQVTSGLEDFFVIDLAFSGWHSAALAEKKCFKVDKALQTSIPPFLTKVDIDVKSKNEHGTTQLMFAASSGDFTTCRKLIQTGTRIDAIDNDGSSALLIAVYHGQKDVVEVLLNAGADPLLERFTDQLTPMHVAVRLGALDIFKLLEQNTNTIPHGLVPIAAFHGHCDLLEYLLTHEIASADAQMALNYAAANGHLDIVKYLVSLEIPLNEVENNPLLIAAAHGHTAIVYYLLAAGANLDITNTNGDTIVHILAKHNRIELLHELWPLIQETQNLNGVLELLNHDEYSSLMCAIAYNHIGMIDALIYLGSSFPIVGWSWLHVAVHHGHLNLIQYLSTKYNLAIDPNDKSSKVQYCLLCVLMASREAKSPRRSSVQAPPQCKEPIEAIEAKFRRSLPQVLPMEPVLQPDISTQALRAMLSPRKTDGSRTPRQRSYRSTLSADKNSETQDMKHEFRRANTPPRLMIDPIAIEDALTRVKEAVDSDIFPAPGSSRIISVQEEVAIENTTINVDTNEPPKSTQSTPSKPKRVTAQPKSVRKFEPGPKPSNIKPTAPNTSKRVEWLPGQQVLAKRSEKKGYLAGTIQKSMGKGFYMIVFDDATIDSKVPECNIKEFELVRELDIPTPSNTNLATDFSSPLPAIDDSYRHRRLIGLAAFSESSSFAEEANGSTGSTAVDLNATLLEGLKAQMQRLAPAIKDEASKVEILPDSPLKSTLSVTPSFIYNSTADWDSTDGSLQNVFLLDVTVPPNRAKNLLALQERMDNLATKIKTLAKERVSNASTMSGTPVLVYGDPCYYGRVAMLHPSSQVDVIDGMNWHRQAALDTIQVLTPATDLRQQHKGLSKLVDLFAPGARVLVMVRRGQMMHATIRRRGVDMEFDIKIDRTSETMAGVRIHQLVCLQSPAAAPPVLLRQANQIKSGQAVYRLHEQVFVLDTDIPSTIYMAGVISGINSNHTVVIEYENGEMDGSVPLHLLKKYDAKKDRGRIRPPNCGPVGYISDDIVLAKHPVTKAVAKTRITSVHANTCDVCFHDGVVVRNMPRSRLNQGGLTIATAHAVNSVAAAERFKAHQYVLAFSNRFQRYCTGQIQTVNVTTTPLTYTVIFDYGEAIDKVPADVITEITNTNVLTPTKRITHNWSSVNGYMCEISFPCNNSSALHEVVCVPALTPKAPAAPGDLVLAQYRHTAKYYQAIVQTVSKTSASVVFASTETDDCVPFDHIFVIDPKYNRPVPFSANITDEEAQMIIIVPDVHHDIASIIDERILLRESISMQQIPVLPRRFSLSKILTGPMMASSMSSARRRSRDKVISPRRAPKLFLHGLFNKLRSFVGLPINGRCMHPSSVTPLPARSVLRRAPTAPTNRAERSPLRNRFEPEKALEDLAKTVVHSAHERNLKENELIQGPSTWDVVRKGPSIHPESLTKNSQDRKPSKRVLIRDVEKERKMLSMRDIYDGLHIRDPNSKYQPGAHVYARKSPNDTEFEPGHIQKIIRQKVYMIVYDDTTIVEEVNEADIDPNNTPQTDFEDDNRFEAHLHEVDSLESEQAIIARVVQSPTPALLQQFLDSSFPDKHSSSWRQSSHVSIPSSQQITSHEDSISLDIPMPKAVTLDMVKWQQERLRSYHDKLLELKTKLYDYGSTNTGNYTLVRGAWILVTTPPCYFGQLDSINAEENTCGNPPVRSTVGVNEISLIHVAQEIVGQYQELTKKVDFFYTGARTLMVESTTGSQLQAAVIIRRILPTECQVQLEKQKDKVLTVPIQHLVALPTEKEDAPQSVLEPLLKVVIGTLEFTIHEQVTVQGVEMGTSAHGVIAQICSLQSVVIEFENGEVDTGVPTSFLRKYVRHQDPSHYFGSMNLGSAFGFESSSEAFQIDDWVITNHPLSQLPEKCRVIGVTGHRYDVYFADGAVSKHVHIRKLRSANTGSIPEKPRCFSMNDYVLALNPRFRRFCTGQITFVHPGDPIYYTVVFDCGETLTHLPHTYVHLLQNTQVLTPRRRVTHNWKSVHGLDAVNESIRTYPCHGDLMLHKMLCTATSKREAAICKGDPVLARYCDSHKYFLGVITSVTTEGYQTASVQFASMQELDQISTKKVFSIKEPPPRRFELNLTKNEANPNGVDDVTAQRLMAMYVTTTSSRAIDNEIAPAPPRVTMTERNRHRSVPLLESQINHSESRHIRQGKHRNPSSILPKVYFDQRHSSLRCGNGSIKKENEVHERRRLSKKLSSNQVQRGLYVPGQAICVKSLHRPDGFGHIQECIGGNQYIVVLEDASILENIGEDDLARWDDEKVAEELYITDAEDGVEFREWWLPRIELFLNHYDTFKTASEHATEIEAIVPNYIQVPDMPDQIDFEEVKVHVKKLKEQMESRQLNSKTPRGEAVGAHVLVRGPPAYFGKIQNISNGGDFYDILDAHLAQHMQVPKKLVKFIDLDTQLHELCHQLQAQLESSQHLAYPVVSKMTQVENNGITFSIHSRVVLKETSTAGLIVAINSNNTVAIELETGFTDGSVKPQDLDKDTTDQVEEYITTSSISKTFNLTSADSNRALPCDSDSSRLPTIYSVRFYLINFCHQSYSHAENQMPNPRWEEYCTAMISDITAQNIATVVFDYGEIYKEIPMGKFVDICNTSVVCDLNGTRLNSTWSYSHGWEGITDTSSACKGEVFLHQMICVAAETQAKQLQYHVGDIVLARYWGTPMYHRGIVVKIDVDFSIHIMFESGHIQRNVPLDHIMPTAKEQVKVMEKALEPSKLPLHIKPLK
ncbi:hypothetical protein THRCLA_22674, partial [Thraustotheca clavata]